MTLERSRIALHRGWSLWRWFVLRGAGLPAKLLAELAAHDSVAVADRLIAHEDAVSAARRDAIAALERVIEPLLGDARKPVGRALKKLRSGRLPEPIAELGEGVDPIQILSRMENALASSRADAERVFAQDSRRISEYLRAVASDTRFLEACTWQNRAAVRTAIDRVREGRASNQNQHRQHEQLVARYLQRYCAKNDTIGFFGPIAWGTFVADAASATAKPGAELLSRRTVYFEHWGIDELATMLSEDAELLPHIAPRRMPTIRLDGRVLHHGAGTGTELPEDIARLLAACDGSRSAREIAAVLLEVPACSFEDEHEVYSLLSELRDRKLVRWSIDLAIPTAFPEQALRSVLERVDKPARDAGLAALDALEVARTSVASAPGDPRALASALDRLDDTFVRLTGREATRKAGAMYAGRTLVYEDCRRDFDLRLGPELVSRLGPPLSLVLQSARWYTYAVADRVRGALEAIYDEVRTEAGEVVDYPRFFDRAVHSLPSESGEGDVVDEVLGELHRRWAAILEIAPDARRIERTSEALAPAVARAFTAPGPGWPVARFHSPDLMIAARSAAEVLAGGGMFVLGEVHTGRTTLTIPLFLKECPFVDELLRADREDVAAVRVRPIVPKHLAARPDFGPPVERDFDIEAGITPSHLPRARVIAAADLVVTRNANGLVVRTRDGRLCCDVIAFFELFLQTATQARWSLFGGVAHAPRVVIDGLVVARERWGFRPEELDFARRERGWDQFIAARRWATAHGIPRYVFAKTPEERKPVYCDLASPIYVEMLSKVVRSASKITVAEMLPSVDDLWLADSRGELYTCELRMTAVDPVQFSDPPRT